MRSTLYAVTLVVSVAFGASGASAQSASSEYTNIGGDLKWPEVHAIEEPAQPQGNATARPRREPSASTSAAQSSNSSQSPQTTGATGSGQRQAAGQDDSSRSRRDDKRNASRDEPEKDKVPPVPMRAVRAPVGPAAPAAQAAAATPPAPVRDAAHAMPPATPVALREAAPVAVPTPPREAAPAPAQTVPVAATLPPPAPAVAPVEPAPVMLSMAVPEASPPPTPEQKPDPLIAKFAGQMLIVGFDGTAPDEAATKQIVAQIESGRIGGVVIAPRNVVSPGQLTKLMNALRRTKAATVPFLAVEQEGGVAQAMAADHGFRSYPSASDLGETNDPLIAYSVYQTMASELGGYGFNLNLGPVVDLRQNEANPAIAVKRRSYGAQPKHVAAFAKAFRIAHHDIGLLTALKHFPGFGSADRDAQDAPADIEAHWSAAELEPYRELVASESADMVMMGHLTHSGFSDEPGLPASLSEKAVKRLRTEIGFDGVVLSDDLELAAITARYPLEDRVLRAIKAGNDVLLIGQRNAAGADLPDRIAAIIARAVASGAISRDKLQASYDRIIALKQKLSPAAQALAAAKRGGNDTAPGPAQ